MVKDYIDIKTLTLAELNGVISLYPWYGAARKELCTRMSALGNVWSADKYAEAALYIPSRGILASLIYKGKAKDYSDKEVRELMKKEAEAPASKFFVVGGDYFSQAEYDSVRRKEDNIFSTFAAKETDVKPESIITEDFTDFCTESLAEVYLDQGYPQQAKAIYSKLILRYPEKSAYFAGLIEKIDKKI